MNIERERSIKVKSVKMKLKSDPKKIGITGMVFYEDI